jgi:hypothetical protein
MTESSRTWNLHDGHGGIGPESNDRLYRRVEGWIDEWIEHSAGNAIDGIIALDLAYKICEKMHWLRPTRGMLERWYRCILEHSAGSYGAFADCIEECNEAGFHELTNKWLCIFNDYLRDREGYREIAGIVQCHINEKRELR